MKTDVALLLLVLAFRLSLAADAEAWKSQILYFAITDRFAQAPGVKPLGPCKLTGWNNGTWSGITQHLDYIKDLGMTAIWITPIPKQYDRNFFGETGYHGYWTQDWTRLEPHFGTEEDLQTLLTTAKQKGVKMMLDVVGNHVGPVGNNFSAIIPFNKPEHYHRCSQDCDQHCSIPQSAYDSSPQQYTIIEQCRLQGLPDLNQTNPEVKNGLIQWLKDTLAKFDFDGLRVDTVKHVDPDFWRAYTEAAGRFTLGEVLNGDNMNILRYTQGPKPAMNSVLNFPIYYHLNNAYAHKQDMRQLATERQKQYTILGEDVVSTMGNFIDNHDVPRFLTIQPDQQLLRNALAWVLIADGIPTIYYGTASGLKGENYAGLNRGCLWEQGYKEDELYGTVQTLAKFRTARLLWQLPEQTVAATADCFVFSRGPDVLVVTTNRGSNSAGSCSVELPGDSVLMRNGVSGIHDVLAAPKGHDTGLVWYPETRRLTISTPNGSPRVLTSTPFTPQRLIQGKPAITNCTTDCPVPAAAKATVISTNSSGVTSGAGRAVPGLLAAFALLLCVLVL